MSKAGRNLGIYFLVIMLIMVFVMFLNKGNAVDTKISSQKFEEALEKGTITSVEISQNKETPTGIMQIILKGGEKRIMNISNVESMEKILKDNNVDYITGAMPKESMVVQYILPGIAVLLVVVLLFSFMNAKGSAGGANSKMMNFGKNRAKLSTADNKLRFSNVAGLIEEKEELAEIVDFLKSCG